MSAVTLASRIFGADDQASFARLSGDVNPIHVDPQAARRTQAGAMVVHGVHAVLWALDKLVEQGAVTADIVSIKVQFTKFIYVGARADLTLRRRDPASIKAELSVDGLTTTALTLAFGTRKQIGDSARDTPASGTTATDRPAMLTRMDELAQRSGWLDAAASIESVQRQFPHAVSALGARRIAAIAQLSTLVGMVCPGLYSLFAAFSVDSVDDADEANRVRFNVSGVDERFRMVHMNISGAGLRGSVQAFLRWPPVAQASLDDIAKLVAPTEFAGSTVLVVGGSRGLGALTAKIISTGGGRTILTYVNGRQEAQQLAQEIDRRFERGRCRAIPYDAHRNAAAQFEHLDAEVSHLYYFATGAIAKQKPGLFIAGLLDEFMQLYVKGFYDCCRAVRERQSSDVAAFYPSSIFVENNPPAMAEYSMAKMAGEILCANMNRANAGVRVDVSRLPRLLTDQTATVPPIESGDPLQVMLPIIRRVQSPPARK